MADLEVLQNRKQIDCCKNDDATVDFLIFIDFYIASSGDRAIENKKTYDDDTTDNKTYNIKTSCHN